MWDILYAIDASTSMGEIGKPKSGDTFVKVDAAKDAFVEVLGNVPFPFGARVGVLGFRAPTKARGMMLDRSQEFYQELIPLTSVDVLRSDPRLRERLDGLRVGGATPTGEALEKVVQVLHSADQGPVKRIKKAVLVTDATANTGKDPKDVLKEGLSRQVIVDVVSIGNNTDRKTFEFLTRRTGGTFTQVMAPKELAAAFDPRIPYVEAPRLDLQLTEAERVSTALKGTNRGSASYPGIAKAAADVKASLERRLREIISLEGEARTEADVVVAAALRDEKASRMSMKEYSDRVWSACAELAKVEAQRARYERALASFQT
jgi:hypothetical protein